MSVSLGDSYFMAAIQYCSLFGVKGNIIVEDVKGLFYKTGRKHTRNHIFSSEKNPNSLKKQKEKYNSWSPEMWTIVHDHCWVFYTEKKKSFLKYRKCCAFLRESWRNAQPQRVLRCVPKASASGCTGEPLCELRGRAVRKAAGNLTGAGMPSGASAAFQLHPWSLSELSAALPTPAHIFHWFWIPAWPWNCSIPMSGATSPVQLHLPPLGSGMGLWAQVPALTCPPAPCHLPWQCCGQTLFPCS